MGTPHPAPRALPLLAAFSADTELLEREIADWREHYGPERGRFGPFLFAQTDYYAAEMGTALAKVIVVGGTPLAADRLTALKLETNAREAALARSGKRTINLDPGLLTPAQVVLATTKPAAHRIYLADGIFAEVTLRYHTGSYQPEAWTYPDFRDPRLIAFFNRLRPELLARDREEQRQ